MLTHRLQVLIDPDQHMRLREEANARGMTIGALVREAIDRRVPPSPGGSREAFDRLMALEPIPVPDDPDDLHLLEG